MAEIDLISEYGNRNIEGADIYDVIKALKGEGGIFERDEQNYTTLTHKPTGRKIVLECARSYFEPKKSYYKLHDKADCSFVQRALGVTRYTRGCHDCILSCHDMKLAIKPCKIRWANDYYFK